MAERRTAWFATRARRPGATRAGVEALIEDQPGLNPVLVELARSTADLVDTAKRQQDPKQWLAASSRLLAVLDRLGASDERGDGAQAGGAGGVSVLAGLVGGSPEVRDAAASGEADIWPGDQAGC